MQTMISDCGNIALQQRNHNIIPDAKDMAIAESRRAEWDVYQGPRVGDWCIMPDGSERRFTHAWPEGLQTTHPISGLGSFYLWGPSADYSGGLDRTIPHERIKATGQLKAGWFWFFHHGHTGASRAVGCSIPCRVYKILAP